MGKRVDGYSYFSSLWALLLETVKSIRAWFLLVILLDFLFYAGLFGMMSLAAHEIKSNYDTLTFPDPSLQQQISEAEASQMLEQMKSFRDTTIALLMAVAVGAILWWSICKGVIWSITLKEKIRIRTLWRFFMLNLAWLGCWMLLIASLAYAINFAQAKYFFLGLIGFFGIVTSSICTRFIPNPSFASFKEGLLFSFKKFHLLAFPCMLLFLAYALFARVFSISPHIAMQIGLMAFTLIFAAFSRSYFAGLVQLIVKEKK